MTFTEHQMFPDWLRYGLVLVTMIAVVVMWKTNTHILLTASAGVIMSITSATLFFWRLDTTVDSQQISITIAPFVKNVYPLTNIKQWEVRRYSPIGEYGGWGVRFGPKSTAYNVRGNIGLDLETNDGQKYMIGTQKPEELKRTLLHYAPKKQG